MSTKIPLRRTSLALAACVMLAAACGDGTADPGEPEPTPEPAVDFDPWTETIQRPTSDPGPEPGAGPEPGIDPEPGAGPEPGIDPEPGVDPEPEVDPTTGCTPVAAPSPMRRLTRREYNYVVEDLLGVASQPALSFVPEETALGFDNNADALWVSQVLAEQYIGGAEDVAGQATADLTALLPCDPAVVGQSECAAAFIDAFGTRALRRPLLLEERDGLTALYDEVLASDGETFTTAIASVVEALLLSPSFLYRVELGEDDLDGDGVVAVDDYEVASRLSFLFWASMPDEELFAAAAAGELSTGAQVEAQARRLLADPKASRTVDAFHDQWLHLNEIEFRQKDPAMYPDFDAQLRADLAEESHRFVRRVVLEGGTWQELLTSDGTYLNARLAAHYGVEGSFGDDLEWTAGLDHRAGVLTQGALLAVLAKTNQTSPILRGVFAREQLLCEPLSPPPDDADIQPPDPDPNLSTRERFAQHTADPNCQSCHELIDPIGFGFEDFDPVGRYRTHEGNGLPVDASGEVLYTFGFDNPLAFHGVVELAAGLAGEDKPAICYAKQWWRFGYGRLEGDADSCGLDWLETRFDEEGGSIEELLVGLTQTPSFRYRTVQDPTEPDLAPGNDPGNGGGN